MSRGDDHVSEPGQIAAGVLEPNYQALFGQGAHGAGAQLDLDRTGDVVRCQGQLEALLQVAKVRQ